MKKDQILGNINSNIANEKNLSNYNAVLDYEENASAGLAYLKAKANFISDDAALLEINLNFDEYTIKESVRFSLKRATLSVNMFGCTMPYDQRQIRNYLPQKENLLQEISIESSGVEQSSKASAIDATLSVKNSDAVKAGIKSEKNINIGTKHSTKYTFDNEAVLISSSGSDSKPIWTVRASKGQEFLQGELPTKTLGIVNINNFPASLEYRLTVSSSDINVTGVGVLGPTSLTRKKYIIFKILALRKLKYKPYLSQANLTLTELGD